ncbi:hypothetical protein QFZ62_000429 [Clavibacter sp. B3I6]|nr:hypothetical protein [Clavibacter sp. B3I6]
MASGDAPSARGDDDRTAGDARERVHASRHARGGNRSGRPPGGGSRPRARPHVAPSVRTPSDADRPGRAPLGRLRRADRLVRVGDLGRAVRRERAGTDSQLHDAVGHPHRQLDVRPRHLRHAQLPRARHRAPGVPPHPRRDDPPLRGARHRRVPLPHRVRSRLHHDRVPPRPPDPRPQPLALAPVAERAALPGRVLLARAAHRLRVVHGLPGAGARAPAVSGLPRRGRVRPLGRHRLDAPQHGHAGPRQARRPAGRDARGRGRHHRHHQQRRAVGRADPRAQLVARARPSAPRRRAEPHGHRRPRGSTRDRWPACR